jgi:UPF0716 protein FxsA
MGKVALFLVLLPVAELYVLVQLADAIGGWSTLLLVLTGMMLGTTVARIAGFRVATEARQALATGKAPSSSVLNGALLLLAALLLIIPGVITDVLAVALLIPWSRRLVAARVVASVERAIQQGSFRVVSTSPVDPWNPRPRPRSGTIIDTEGETVESSVVAEDSKPPPRLQS